MTTMSKKPNFEAKLPNDRLHMSTRRVRFGYRIFAGLG
jgi:hypothetical protein